MRIFQRLLFGILALVAVPVWAATSTTTMPVNATVVPACTISATALNFGATIANPIAANVDAQTNLTATCSNGAAYTVALDAGTGAGGTIITRHMTGPSAATMNYSLFTTAARGTVWGDGTAGSATVAGTGNGAGQTLTVFGRIPPQTVANTGAYSDTITVTITF